MSRISNERMAKALEQLKSNDSPASCLGSEDAVLMIQVLEDSWTRNPEDAQKIFDLLASKDKDCSGCTRRFKDGYNYFGRHPEKIIAFFDRYLK